MPVFVSFYLDLPEQVCPRRSGTPLGHQGARAECCVREMIVVPAVGCAEFINHLVDEL